MTNYQDIHKFVHTIDTLLLDFAGHTAAQQWLQKTSYTDGSACCWGDNKMTFSCLSVIVHVLFKWLSLTELFFFVSNLYAPITSSFVINYFSGIVLLGSFWSRSTMCCTMQVRSGIHPTLHEKLPCFIIFLV